MGAGATVYAGIYLPTKPRQSFQVNFTTNDDACMNDSGGPANLTVSEAGVTAVSVGYVESKVSGCKCLSAASYWTLAYNAPGTPYSGSAKTQWYCPPEYNEISLVDAVQTTCVNTLAAEGTARSQKWHGTGTLYIIFNPVAQQLITTLPLLKHFSPDEKHALIDDVYRPLVGEHFLKNSKPCG